MGTWTLEIDLDWPPDDETRAQWLERLLREVVDPLHRENVTVNGVRLVLKDDWQTVCACELFYVCSSCRDSSRFDDVYADFREPEVVVVYGESDDDE